MQFSALLAAFLTGAVVSAAPTANTANDNAKRSCAVAYPAGVSQVHLALNPAFNAQQPLTFNIPAGASGPCSLVATFPAGYSIASSGNAQVNVIAVDGPAPGAIVGTTTFASQPNANTYTTINSFACRPSMSYQLTLVNPYSAVDFAEGNGAGVIMTYDC